MDNKDLSLKECYLLKITINLIDVQLIQVVDVLSTSKDSI